MVKLLEAIPATVLGIQWEWSDTALEGLASEGRIAAAKDAAKANDYAKVYRYKNVAPLVIQDKKADKAWADCVDLEGNIITDGKKGDNWLFLVDRTINFDTERKLFGCPEHSARLAG